MDNFPNANCLVIANLLVTCCILMFMSVSFKLSSPTYSSSSNGSILEEKTLAVNSTFDNINKSSPSSKCLSTDEDLESLINNATQIFNLHPPKTGGNTMHYFTQDCYHGDLFGEGAVMMPQMASPTFHNKRDEVLIGRDSTRSIPGLITSHVMLQPPLIQLVQSVTDDSLIIYNYRSETDRMASGIKQVVKSYYCASSPAVPQPLLQDGIRTEEECVIYEHSLVQLIKLRFIEIGGGNSDLLNCNTFDVIEENKPNFVLYDMHYLDKLQSAFAKKYCPELEGKSHHENVDSSKRQAMVRIDKQGSAGTDPTVPDMTIDEWVEKRKHLLEWSFDLRKGASCRGKMREYAKELSTCVEDGGVGIFLSSVP